MKTKFICALLAASTMVFTACSLLSSKSETETETESESEQSAESNDDDERSLHIASPKTFEDSLAVITGRYTSASLVRNIAGLSEEDRAKINREAFMKGLELVINADTATINDYLSGMQFGMQQMNGFMQMYEAGIDIDRRAFLKAFAKGFKADNVSDEEFDMVSKEMQPISEKLSDVLLAGQQKKMGETQKSQDEKFAKNKKAGENFINKLKADKNVKFSKSGLAYKMKKMGSGVVAKDTDRVNVKYVGKTIDGKEFDSSNGQAVTFPVQGVIPGFAEALTTFPVGTEVVLFIPENLAYGRQGTDSIEPGSTLIFDMTILGIEK